MSHDPTAKFRFLMASGVAVAMLAAWCQAGEPISNKQVPSGKLDRAAILRELTDFSPEGMDRRLGLGYAFYHRRGPQQKFPKAFMAERKHGTDNRYYQIGGPWTKEAGDYSSTQGQVLYAADKGCGVDRVTIIEWAHGCWTESPEPPWWGGFRPEPASADWQEAAKGDPGAPIMMARGMGSWANCGVIVFSSGLVATAGTCTAKGANPTFHLPAQKIPTAVAVTNKNEFALVTVCDVQQKKGQVAVLALEGSGKQSGFAHDWPDAHPCVANVAFLTRIKLLGYVDLPGMEFPTGLTAVADTHGVEASLLTVADFKGRKIINYRYSEVVFATQGGARFGMGPTGKDHFECGGVLEFPGSPLGISATNVN